MEFAPGTSFLLPEGRPPRDRSISGFAMLATPKLTDARSCAISEGMLLVRVNINRRTVTKHKAKQRDTLPLETFSL